ncbi:unnamed protein product, partial [Heterosigma akashiwo]
GGGDCRRQCDTACTAAMMILIIMLSRTITRISSSSSWYFGHKQQEEITPPSFSPVQCPGGAKHPPSYLFYCALFARFCISSVAIQLPDDFPRTHLPSPNPYSAAALDLGKTQHPPACCQYNACCHAVS